MTTVRIRKSTTDHSQRHKKTSCESAKLRPNSPQDDYQQQTDSQTNGGPAFTRPGRCGGTGRGSKRTYHVIGRVQCILIGSVAIINRNTFQQFITISLIHTRPRDLQSFYVRTGSLAAIGTAASKSGRTAMDLSSFRSVMLPSSVSAGRRPPAAIVRFVVHAALGWMYCHTMWMAKFVDWDSINFPTITEVGKFMMYMLTLWTLVSSTAATTTIPANMIKLPISPPLHF